LSTSLPPSSEEVFEKRIAIRNPYKVLLVLFLFFFGWLLAKNAWYGDDAFITMRVIDNFINGYGLVWNIGERVQVFTHPLWLLCMTPIYAILKDPYQTIYWLSFIVSLATIYLFLSKFTKSCKSLLVAGLLMGASMAFIDYSSSGLENPLTHLLLILMLILVLKQPTTLKTLLFTSLIASLAAVNRLDSILFYIPVLGYQFYELRAAWPRAFAAICIGFLPLIAWELFALIYYGFPVPNTYYAKLAATNIPEGWYHDQAWEYLRNSFRWDPITLGTIALSMGFVIWERNIKKITIVVGMASYLYYIDTIGGDFMSGRFFSALFLIAAVLLMTVDYAPLIGISDTRTYLFVVGLILFLGLAAEYPPVLTQNTDSDRVIDTHGIANERLFYFKETSWSARTQFNTIHRWGQEGLDIRKSGDRYAARDSVGLFGYYAGPDVYILDCLALSDPLRSRLPTSEHDRIGHFRRAIPVGYEDTLKDPPKNHIVNPDLRLYYDKLGILIHGDVFAPGRLQEIINFNLGRYDYLIKRYNDAPDPE
jgi:arabinofuranosyltransferase